MSKTVVLSGHGMVNLASSPAFVTLPARAKLTVWAPNTYVQAGVRTQPGC